MLALPGCGRGPDPEKTIVESLRAIPGVRKAATMPWLLRAPDYLFTVDLDDDPTADTLAEVIRVYGATVTALPSGNVEVYIRWRNGDQKREIKGWGFQVPTAEQAKAVADWPRDLQMRGGFYTSQGFVISVYASDADLPRVLARVSTAGLKGDDMGVYSDRFKVSWDTAAPVSNFEAARAAAPTATLFRVRQVSSPDGGDSIYAEWAEATPAAVRPEMEALTDVWAASPTPLRLELRVGGEVQAELHNDRCPDPTTSRPLDAELWAYAQRPGHRIVLAPDC